MYVCAGKDRKGGCHHGYFRINTRLSCVGRLRLAGRSLQVKLTSNSHSEYGNCDNFGRE